jgi:cell division protein FtsL
MFGKTVFVLLSVLLVQGAVACLVEAQVPSSTSPQVSSPPNDIWSLSPTELAVIAAIIVVVTAVVGFALYQRVQLRSIQKQTAMLKAKTAELRARQSQSVSAQAIIFCKFCGVSIKEEAAFCPVCQKALK